MSDTMRQAEDIPVDEWKQALQSVVHRQITGPGQQAWVTREAVWVTADKVESGLRGALAVTTGFHRPFECIENLICHGIVPVPRACAFLWRIAPKNTSVKQVMLLEITTRLFPGICYKHAPWSLEDIDVNHIKYLAILRSGTTTPQETGSPCPYESDAQSSLAILSPPRHPGKVPEEPHVVLTLFHEPTAHEGPRGSTHIA